jgi:CubicO group peptidase (beta-lactamase class C family)
MHHRHISIALSYVMAAAAPAMLHAQASQERPFPRGVGARPSLALRDSLQRTLQSILDKGVADSAFPGAIAVVGTREGRLVAVTAGHLDWAPSPRPDEHTLWDVASLSKVVGLTSAMMQLVEAKKVDLDAPVQRYLPDWTGPHKELVTVRQLLSHSGGLPPDWPRGSKPYDEITHDPDSVAKLMFWTPLDTLPGVRMVYSDIGAFILGRIVEQVTGQSLDLYLHDHVFKPLGMNETMYRPPVALRPRIAPTERDTMQRKRLVVGMVHDERAYYIGGVSGHAGIFSSAHDLERLARTYLNGGTFEGGTLASRATLALFTTVRDSTFSSRALGWDTPKDSWFGHFVKRPAFGHTGFTGTSIIIAPDQDLYVILLTNRVNPTREHSRITPVRAAVSDAAMRILHPSAVSAIESRSPASTPQSGRP